MNDWDADASDDLLAQVLAVSQQEYLESLKKNKSPSSSNDDQNSVQMTSINEEN